MQRVLSSNGQCEGHQPAPKTNIDGAARYEGLVILSIIIMYRKIYNFIGL